MKRHRAAQYDLAGQETAFNLAGELIRQEPPKAQPDTKPDDRTPDLFKPVAKFICKACNAIFPEDECHIMPDPIMPERGPYIICPHCGLDFPKPARQQQDTK